MKLRKITALLLVLGMMLSLSVSAFAADDTIASGTIPDSKIKWSLDSNGWLTISGSGEAPVFQSPDDQPWAEYREQITEIWYDDMSALTGKDKGKKGKVLEAMTASGKLVIEGINVATCHVKPKKQGEEGGIISREIPIYASKVMLVCPKCGKATRHAVKLADGKKARVCKKCGQEI